jgi:hypothetical protein
VWRFNCLRRAGRVFTLYSGFDARERAGLPIEPK